MKRVPLLTWPVLLAFSCTLALGDPLGTVITYQGRLATGGQAANGIFDFRFAIYDAAAVGNALGGPLTNAAVNVADGLFTTTLDFGANIFTGDARWLEIAVRTNGSGAYHTLATRQALTPAPYALWTSRAGSVADGAILLSALGQNGAVNGQVIQWSAASNAWVAAQPAAGTTSLLGYKENGPFAAPPVASGNNAIAQGDRTQALGDNSVVGGGYWNIAGAVGAVVSGGGADGGLWIAGTSGNKASAPASTVGGGVGNIASGSYSTVGGGLVNATTNTYTTIGGGGKNIAGAVSATVAGGYQNSALGQDSAVAGGYKNSATGVRSIVAGGYNNTASGDMAIVSGGQANAAGASQSAVAGGFGNVANGDSSFIGGGVSNYTAIYAGVIGGGEANLVLGQYATIAGGNQNVAGAYGAVIGGGHLNHATNQFGAVAGGINNVAGGNRSTVGGGDSNQATGAGACVGGGGWDGTNVAGNTAAGDASVVSGGWQNGAWNYATTVSGGAINAAGPAYSTVSGGYENGTDGAGTYGTIGGGYENYVKGTYATVPGGYQNYCGGRCSFAAGQHAHAAHDGTFVWADNSTDASLWSSATNQFIVRATGGVFLMTKVDSTSGAPINGMYLSAGGSGWNSYSDRNAKANFSEVDARDILERLARIPIKAWNYRTQDPSVRHVGPMAQDFNAAFGTGEADKTGEKKYINSVDADGVALAAIQGLNQKVEEKLAAQAAALHAKDAEIQALNQRLDALEQRLAR